MNPMSEAAPQPVGDGTPPRAARRLVAVLLTALLVPGIIGFDFWPLTGWRLFSLSRDDTAFRGAAGPDDPGPVVIEGVYADGTSRIVDFEELPYAYSNAEWPLRSVIDGSREQAEDLCRALLGAVVETNDEVVELRIALDTQELVEVDGEWTVSHDLDVRHACLVEER